MAAAEARARQGLPAELGHLEGVASFAVVPSPRATEGSEAAAAGVSEGASAGMTEAGAWAPQLQPVAIEEATLPMEEAAAGTG